MIYGYCRVSTKGQLKEGYSLEAQENEILIRYPNAIVFKEQYTGSKIDRPVFSKIIGELKATDTLTITKLDRLARNTYEGIEIVQRLFDMGVAVHVLNIGLLENTTMGKFFLTTLLAVAEMEKNTIIERTQSGKEVARTKAGYREGRKPKYTSTQLDYAVSLLEEHSYTVVAKMTQISKATLVREVRKRKV